MKGTIIALLLLMGSFCNAQGAKGRTAVFKVRAPLATCTIVCNDLIFLQEKESIVTVKVEGRNAKTKVIVTGAKVVGQKDDSYRLRFFNVGDVIISVFQIRPNGSKLIAQRKSEIKAPRLFFCGLPVDSASKVLKLGKCHLYAWSDYWKQNLPVNKFSMLYYESINTSLRKSKTDTLKSVTCKMTPEMRQRVVKFQPMTNKIYFYNMLCTLPDGTFRLLEPVELFASKDSTLNDLSVVYHLKKKKVE